MKTSIIPGGKENAEIITQLGKILAANIKKTPRQCIVVWQEEGFFDSNYSYNVQIKGEYKLGKTYDGHSGSTRKSKPVAIVH